MDRVERNKKILLEYLQGFLEVAQEDNESVTTQLVEDTASATYLVLTYGWLPERFVHYVVFHFQVKENGSIWLYQNRTNKIVVEELAELDIATSDIVVALSNPYSEELKMAA
ncbi:MAG: element excision factor XisI family protein [Bacteroidota bacterium]